MGKSKDYSSSEKRHYIWGINTANCDCNYRKEKGYYENLLKWAKSRREELLKKRIIDKDKVSFQNGYISQIEKRLKEKR